MEQLFAAVLATWAIAAAGPASAPPTVVVELFTSEGCSSCPPADEVLAELVRQQPVTGVVVIGLGEHVDYWNGQGWRDPYSSSAFTARQSEYDARVFHTESIYTPQVVVDGHLQVLGSDRAAVYRSISEAARVQKAVLTLHATANGAAGLRLDIHADIPDGLASGQHLDVIAAVIEQQRVTSVQGGENRGHTLNHAAVARAIRLVGEVGPAERAFSRTVTVPLDAGWEPSGLQVAVWLQLRESRHIVGVASAHLEDAPRQ